MATVQIPQTLEILEFELFQTLKHSNRMQSIASSDSLFISLRSCRPRKKRIKEPPSRYLVYRIKLLTVYVAQMMAVEKEKEKKASIKLSADTGPLVCSVGCVKCQDLMGELVKCARKLTTHAFVEPMSTFLPPNGELGSCIGSCDVCRRLLAEHLMVMRKIAEHNPFMNASSHRPTSPLPPLEPTDDDMDCDTHGKDQKDEKDEKKKMQPPRLQTGSGPGSYYSRFYVGENEHGPTSPLYSPSSAPAPVAWKPHSACSQCGKISGAQPECDCADIAMAQRLQAQEYARTSRGSVSASASNGSSSRATSASAPGLGLSLGEVQHMSQRDLGPLPPSNKPSPPAPMSISVSASAAAPQTPEIQVQPSLLLPPNPIQPGDKPSNGGA